METSLQTIYLYKNLYIFNHFTTYLLFTNTFILKYNRAGSFALLFISVIKVTLPYSLTKYLMQTLFSTF